MRQSEKKMGGVLMAGLAGLGLLAITSEALAQVVVVPPPPPHRRVAPPPPRRLPPPPRRVPPPVRRVAPLPPAVRVGPGRFIVPAVPLIILPPLVAGYVIPPPPPPPVVNARLVVAYVNTLNLRNCPATNCQVIGVLQRGTPLLFMEYQNGWTRVMVEGTNVEGWVAYKYLAPAP